MEFSKKTRKMLVVINASLLSGKWDLARDIGFFKELYHRRCWEASPWFSRYATKQGRIYRKGRLTSEETRKMVNLGRVKETPR